MFPTSLCSSIGVQLLISQLGHHYACALVQTNVTTLSHDLVTAGFVLSSSREQLGLALPGQGIPTVLRSVKGDTSTSGPTRAKM